jgi:hypothetical protein
MRQTCGNYSDIVKREVFMNGESALATQKCPSQTVIASINPAQTWLPA